MTRDDAITAIHTALQKRSGKAWSVTGGRGTAWGWITIDAPPARRTAHAQLKAGATNTWPESWETVDTGVPGGYITPADKTELTALLGTSSFSVPASDDHYAEYVARAAGLTPAKVGAQYWD